MKKYILLFLPVLLWFISCQKPTDTPTPQPPAPLSLKTDSTSLSLGANNNSLDSFSIQANTAWTITLSPTTATWLRVTPTSGSGNAKIMVTTTAANNIAASRSANIVVSPAGTTTVQPVTVTVTQKAAVPKVVWAKLFGGGINDEATFVLPTTDGGYLITGVAGDNTGDFSGIGTQGSLHEGFAMKVDASGNKVWAKLYGGTEWDQINSVVPTADGGFVLLGQTESYDGDLDLLRGRGLKDVWMLRIDANGNKIWMKRYGGSLDDIGSSIIKTNDGGFLITGRTYSQDFDISGNPGGMRGWLLKLDGNGNKLWSKVYGGTGPRYDQLSAAVQVTDGSFLIAGASDSNDGDVSGNHGREDLWLLKVDKDGNKLWSKLFGGTFTQGAFSSSSIVASPDGGCVVAATAFGKDGDVGVNLGSSDIWLVNVDGNGNKVWSKNLGGPLTEDGGSIITTSNGGFVVLAITSSNSGDFSSNRGEADGGAIGLDANGTMQWSMTFGGSKADMAKQIVATSDGGFAVVGYTGSNDGDFTGNHSQNYNDAFILKVKVP